MNMIMHNGIHYVPATELAKANDKLADRDNRIDELETAAQQLICDIKNKQVGSIVDTEA